MLPKENYEQSGKASGTAKMAEKEAEAFNAQLDSALSHWSDPGVR